MTFVTPPGSRCIVASKALAHTPGLSALMGVPVVHGRAADWQPGDVLAGWGRRAPSERLAAEAARAGLPFVRLEDGFLRSVGLGHEEPPLSIVVDPVGIYYDAGAPSHLENLIREHQPDTADEMRCHHIMQRWQETGVSKYNAARNCPIERLPDDFVLVADQTWGDASIHFGQANAQSFAQMLQAALDEHPQSTVLLKIHPDVVHGRKRGHYDWRAWSEHPRVRVMAENWHPASVLPRARAVYCVTSQLGFEALLWGKPVRCFGMPFYAGWGLTTDALAAPEGRRTRRPMASLVHGSLVAYPRYRHPETGLLCEVEQLLDWMGLQRRMRERFPAQVVAQGFSPLKRPVVRRFFQGSDVRFTWGQKATPAGITRVRWGRTDPDDDVLHLEDGFLRSVGLGADLVRPISWVVDRRGMYFDASRPSDLEHLLQNHPFDDEERARGHRLRDTVVAHGLTKYNVGQSTWQRPSADRPVLLVVGQVETDASLAWGAPDIRSNMALLRRVRERAPDAHLIYKPHPDVVAGLRRASADEGLARQWCDELITHTSMHALLSGVDEVHTLTSLSGFEALLRGKRVVCHGMPFYAGWGLTTDVLPADHSSRRRRSRRLLLDELVAGALLLYPTYVSHTTGRFTTPERAIDELLALRQKPQPPSWRGALRRALLRTIAR
jgi:capsular polysaccharide export protein